MFEAKTGVLNIAPTKISGQYKIVVDRYNILWLDDYTGRRTKIDMSQSFLEQVSRFLSVQTEIADNSVLRYGGFQSNGIKSWHIPFYLGDYKTETNEYPNYFVLLNPSDTHISTEEELFLNNKLVTEVRCLKQIGLHQIFDEINSEPYFNYPLYLHWDENKLNMYGYSIDRRQPIIYSYPLVDLVANQPYVDVLGNRILNNYKRENFIWPRFINIEFEFAYNNPFKLFTNFVGYLSYGDLKPIDFEITENQYPLVLRVENGTETVFEPIKKNIQKVSKEYINTCQVVDVEDKTPQIRFGVFSLQYSDYIQINLGSEIFYRKELTDDFHPTTNLEELLSAWKQICYEIETTLNHELRLSASIDYIRYNGKMEKMVVVSISNSTMLQPDFTFKFPTHFIDIDSTAFEFRSIDSSTDLKCLNKNILNTVLDPRNNKYQLEINNILHEIVDVFMFSGDVIIRLEEFRTDRPKILTICTIYKESNSKTIELKPIPFLTYYSNLESETCLNFDLYKKELLEKFGKQSPQTVKWFNSAYNNFNQQQLEQYQYIIDEKQDGQIVRTDKSNVFIDYFNEEIVRFMLFSSSGSTSALTPYTLNFDKQFFIQNGSVDWNPENHNDYYKYAWFLLNCKPLDNLTHKKAVNRYITDKPKFTSRLIKISDSLCECIFMGVKYQLPVKYKNYRLYTVLNFNDPNDLIKNYTVSIDHIQKLIRVNINKFLDYNDLIRGGNSETEPVVDLSLLYNITHSSDATSLNNVSLSNCNLKIDKENKLKTYRFGDLLVNDWKHVSDAQTYFRLDNVPNLNESPMTLIQRFPDHKNGSELVFSIYDIWNETETNLIKKYQLFEIKLLDVILEAEYLWCTDIQVTYFPQGNRQLFSEISTDIERKLFTVNSDKIVRLETINNDSSKYQLTFYDHQNQEHTKIVELLNINKTISFREQYFEVTKILSFTESGKQLVNYSLDLLCPVRDFRISQYLTDQTRIIQNVSTESELINKLFETFGNNKKDNVSSSQMMNLFGVSQLWNFIMFRMENDLKYRMINVNQIKQEIDKFNIQEFLSTLQLNNNQLLIESELGSVQHYLTLNVVPVNTNLVIWESSNGKELIPKIFEINRYNTCYFPLVQPISDLVQFQTYQFAKHNSFYSLFNDNFQPIGNWREFKGNIVSTLFLGGSIDVYTELQETIDYYKLFQQTINFDLITFGREINQDIIKSLVGLDQSNVNQYIIDEYTKLMLSSFYKIESINVVGNNKQLKFVQDKQEPNLIKIDNYQNVVKQMSIELNELRTLSIRIKFVRI